MSPFTCSFTCRAGIAVAFVFGAVCIDKSKLHGGEAVGPPRNAVDSDAIDDTVDIRKASLACGAKSLLMWLRLLGHSVTYDEVLKYVALGERGANMAQLYEAARHWTDRVQLVKAQPRNLDQLRLPAIAHAFLGSGRGHYVVIVNVTPGSVVFLDSGSGTKEEDTRENFKKIWSGYVLVPTDPFDAFSGPIALVVIGCAVSYGCRNIFRSLKGTTAIALLLACGCNHDPGAPAAPAPSSDARLQGPLAVSGREQHLGTVRLGDSAQATFTLSNISHGTLDLSIGRPSCGCLKSTLSADHLEPGKATELTLLLSNGIDSSNAGKLSARNAVGINGSDDQVFVFEADAVLEGMRIAPYSLRLPAERNGFSPQPIRGEIILGRERGEARVEILDVSVDDAALQDGSAGIMRLGAPTLGDVELLGSHLRRRLQIPVAFSARDDLRSRGVYHVQVTYRIDDRTADAHLRVLVFPEAAVPPRAVDGDRS